ncbi:MAG: DNA mismatch repair protein MutS [Alphaproteobacteria bacterium]|nr:DNA mismatch repair protein MutS [Alphaproteobacteria bacterium]
MMRQYLEIKQAHADCLLFYRMGDFYEMFFEDALTAAPILGIALTKRGKHDDQDIPMCGVPFHSCEHYLDKLIRYGLKVAICEQLETPEQAKKRGYKAVVNREVVRIITPGTITEDALLESHSTHYLAALVGRKQQFAIAWVDISTGEFWVSPSTPLTLASDLARVAPKELVFPESMLGEQSYRSLLMEWKKTLSPQADSFFEGARADRHLKQCFNVSVLDSIGDLSQEETTACGVLVEYLLLTQKGKLPYLRLPRRQVPNHFMNIDAATRRNLEMTQTLSGEKRGSLLATIDYTQSGSGARLLSTMLAMPLANSIAIGQRLDIVEWFGHHPHEREVLRLHLKHMADIERALARITIDRGGPRDMLAIRQSLATLAEIRQMFDGQDVLRASMPKGLLAMLNNLGGAHGLCDELTSALADDVPMLARDGGFIRQGFHARLDELRDLQLHGAERVQQLRDKYREQTGVMTLKIAHNQVVGYYIEVNAQHRAKMDDAVFIHKQTMHQAMRYTTVELQDLEQAILSSSEESMSIEIACFEQLVTSIKQQAEYLMKVAYSAAQLDVTSALAQLAVEKKWVRPFVDDTLAFHIQGGWHPVVADALKGRGEHFTPNDCEFSLAKQLYIITGPNMAGKSTYMRQNALIAILAQIGSFVPASHAHIGTVDALYSRVGAADDLARGLSTFMVEMVETATILNQATARSLVILDEIGRGTATFDGLSIAWACVEYIHDHVQSRTLFATHYHELTSLAERLKHVSCLTMQIKEWQGKVVFLHHVIAGKADRSYGIYVAQHAGIPKPVIHRAKEILALLEQGQAGSAIDRLTEHLPLFGVSETIQNTQVHSTLPSAELSRVERDVLERLRRVSCDELSPREAWEILAQLHELTHDSGE